MGRSTSIWRNRHWDIGSGRRRVRVLYLQWHIWGIEISFPRYGHLGFSIGPLTYESYSKLEFQ